MAKKSTAKPASERPAPELENEPAKEAAVIAADAREDAAKAPPAADAGVEFVPRDYVLKLTQDCAIGHGQRKKGTVLARMQLADGIVPTEIITALRNRRIIEFKAV